MMSTFAHFDSLSFMPFFIFHICKEVWVIDSFSCVQAEVKRVTDSMKRSKKTVLNKEWTVKIKGWLNKYAAEFVHVAHEEVRQQFYAAVLQVCTAFLCNSSSMLLKLLSFVPF